MSELNERISYIIEKLGMTKTAFAERLNVSQAFVSQLCSGIKQPSERTIMDICREFRVNYLWLTEGKGDMFTSTPESVVDELADKFRCRRQFEVGHRCVLRGQACHNFFLHRLSRLGYGIPLARLIGLLRILLPLQLVRYSHNSLILRVKHHYCRTTFLWFHDVRISMVTMYVHR